MLPFSCPFGASKTGKRQQAPAQSEGQKSPITSISFLANSAHGPKRTPGAIRSPAQTITRSGLTRNTLTSWPPRSPHPTRTRIPCPE